MKLPRTEILNAPMLAMHCKTASGTLDDPMQKGIVLRADPAMQISGRWDSPRGRLLELRTQVGLAGDWLGLHVTLPLPHLSGIEWIGFACRIASGEPFVSRACLRSGTAEGLTDCFFDRHVLSQPRETDHHDIMAPARRPDLPPDALWREFVLFLPPQKGIELTLHDLRLFVA